MRKKCGRFLPSEKKYFLYKGLIWKEEGGKIGLIDDDLSKEGDEGSKQDEEVENPKLELSTEVIQTKPADNVKQLKNPEKVDTILGDDEYPDDHKKSDDDSIDFTRYPLPTRIQNLLKEHGDKKIQSIRVGRKPIDKNIDLLLNVITAGEFNRIKKDLNYDAFMHLFILIKLEDKFEFVLEKNQSIAWKPFKYSNDVELKNVKLKDRAGLTLNKFFSNALEEISWKKLTVYDGLNSNCQLFVRDMLKSSGLLSASVKVFILQDIKTIAKRLGEKSSKLMNLITDSAAFLDKWVQKISRGYIYFEDGGVA